MPVMTMDDIKRESAASGGTGLGGGMRPAANPYAGGGAAGSSAGGNYTTAGGYTPIPDQYSMGGVGPGDVFIDACGETVPVFHRACPLLAYVSKCVLPCSSLLCLSRPRDTRCLQPLVL